MRILMILVVGLLVTGCGETEEPVKEELTLEEQKALRASVVGEYEFKNRFGDTIKQVYLENGVREWYQNGNKDRETTWSIVDGEIHDKSDSGLRLGKVSNIIWVYRFNKDKSITYIARIRDGKRTDMPKEDQSTWKKIK